MIPVIAYELAVSTAPRDGAEARYFCRITVQLFYVQQDGTLLKRMG